MARKLSFSSAQSLSAGLLIYILAGFGILSLPFSRTTDIHWLDNLFTVVSAISTTGLTTLSVADSYSFFGQLVLVILFQIGGWGFMTITSFFFIVVRKELSENRIRILNTSYSLPEGFNVKNFILSTVMFTVIIEFLGTILLYIFIAPVKPEHALWSSVFHTISAFATAGFSIYNNSFSDFRNNIPVNIIMSVLCYLGALGFIVIQDFHNGIVHRKKITFTTRVIIVMTALLFILGTVFFFFTEPSIQTMGLTDRLTVSMFQVMTASTTAGFNTLEISALSRSALFCIVILMVVGASPSGTGGGIKTTSISAIFGIVSSVIHRRKDILFFRKQIPLHRALNAVSVTVLYVSVLAAGILLLLLFDGFDFEKTFFEAASALGTVGLSTGITGSLNAVGKSIIILLMYFGRVGPLTIGLALFGKRARSGKVGMEDLAT